MMRLSATLFYLLLLPLSVYSQTVIEVGTGKTYTSLTGNGGLFQNLKNLSDNLDILICSDLQEDGTHMLNLSTSSPYTIRILPDQAAMRTIFNDTKGTPTLQLTGKVRVIVDGRFPHRNSSDYSQAEAPEMGKRFLRFVNGTRGGNGVQTPNTAIQIRYGSQGHVISSCLFQSIEQGSYGSCILLNYGTGQSSNLRIEYCDFGSVTWQEGWDNIWDYRQQVGFGIYANKMAGGDSRQVYISHNRFYNTQWAGVCFVGSHTHWEISNNTFQKSGDYLNAAPHSSHGLEKMHQYSYTAIWADATGTYHIKDNQIGGSAQHELELKAYKATLASPLIFQGIYAKGIQETAEAGISITGNQIGYIKLHTWESATGPNKLVGITVGNRKASITGNTLQNIEMNLTPYASAYYSTLSSQLSGILLENSIYETIVSDNLITNCKLIGYNSYKNIATALLLRGIYTTRNANSGPLQLLHNQIQGISGHFKYPNYSGRSKSDKTYGIHVMLTDNSSPTCILEENQISNLSITDLSESTILDDYTPSAYGIQACGKLTNNYVSGMQISGKAVGIELLNQQGSLRGNRLWNLQAKELVGFRCNSTQPQFHNSCRQQGGIGWEQTSSGGQLYHNALYIEAQGSMLTGGAITKPITYPSGTTIQNSLLLAPYVSYSDASLETDNLLISSGTVQASLLIGQKSLLFRNWTGGDLRLRTTGDLSPCMALLDLLVDRGRYTDTVTQDSEGTPYAGTPDCGLTEFVHRWEGPATETDARQVDYWPLRTLPTASHPASQHVFIPSGTSCLWKNMPLSLRSLQVEGNLRLSGDMAITQQILPTTYSLKGTWVLPGGVLDLQNYTGTLSLSQDLLMEGHWISGTHGLQLSGKGTQLLKSDTPISVGKLTVDKEAESAQPSICHTQMHLEAKQLDMLRGVLDISPNKLLMIQESTTGGNTGALVSGWIAYQGNNETILPLGVIGRYAPLKVDKGPLKACFIDTTPPNSLMDIAQKGYWRLQAQQATLCAVPPLIEGHVQLWKHLSENQSWEHLHTSLSSQGLLQGNLPSKEILFTTGKTPQVAPAWDLLLSARKEGEMVRLAWTYKGLPVLGFSIEYSQDGILFRHIGQVDEHVRIFSERRRDGGHYRLKIWQKEGGWMYSHAITLEDSPRLGLSLWPNPWSQGTLQLRTEETGEIRLQLCDLQGRQVVQYRTLTADGQLHWALPPLPVGCYLLMISGPRTSQSCRLVVQ